MRICIRTSAEDDDFPGVGAWVMFVMILFNLKAFMFWFATDNVIPGNFGFARY